MKAEDYDFSYSQWEHLIDEWVFDEKDRAMLKRHLLDGITYEKLAEEFEYSTQYTYFKIKKAREEFFKKLLKQNIIKK